MRLLNTNKEMPTTLRKTTVFSRSWGGGRRRVVICYIFKLLFICKKKIVIAIVLTTGDLKNKERLFLCCYSLTALWFSHLTCSQVSWHIPFEITVWLLILSPANEVQSTFSGWNLTKTTLAFSTVISQLQVKPWESQSQ